MSRRKQKTNSTDSLLMPPTKTNKLDLQNKPSNIGIKQMEALIQKIAKPKVIVR